MYNTGNPSYDELKLRGKDHCGVLILPGKPWIYIIVIILLNSINQRDMISMPNRNVYQQTNTDFF